jgi:glycogen debranching enzyme
MKIEIDYNIIDRAYERAIETINQCCTKYGLFASGGRRGYKGVWSRDSFITFLGTSLVRDDLFKKTFRKSLAILGKNQSKHGQIPNAVHSFDGKKPTVDFSSIDSSLWFIIGHYTYKKRYKDSSLFHKHREKINRALRWLSYQDVGEDLMLEQLPTTDWQDAFPQRYGRTINTQALYYKVLKLMGKNETARKLKLVVNRSKNAGLWGGEFYYAYRWKNHNKYKEIGDWFDSLGNLLAIVFELANDYQARKIIDYIRKKKISNPYPMRSISPPIRKGSDYWEDYYMDCDAGKPHHYLNGGIWTYIGGFYVLALIKLRKFREAKKELKKLAEANLRGNVFPEWIDPIDKKTHGKWQAWSAGVYMAAYNSLKRKKVLL